MLMFVLAAAKEVQVQEEEEQIVEVAGKQEEDRLRHTHKVEDDKIDVALMFVEEEPVISGCFRASYFYCSKIHRQMVQEDRNTELSTHHLHQDYV